MLDWSNLLVAEVSAATLPALRIPRADTRGKSSRRPRAGAADLRYRFVVSAFRGRGEGNHLRWYRVFSVDLISSREERSLLGKSFLTSWSGSASRVVHSMGDTKQGLSNKQYGGELCSCVI